MNADTNMNALVSIARVDAQLNAHRLSLEQLPRKLEEIKLRRSQIETVEKDGAEHFQQMEKEKRDLEQSIEDNGVKIKKLKTQLMDVKTNKEYTAMLHEIEHIEKNTDTWEERLLLLMDQLDQESSQLDSTKAQTAEQKKTLDDRQKEIEAEVGTVNSEVQQLESEKPKLLSELDPALKRRYDRLLGKMRDFAVTHVEDDICQGCFTRIPPQVSVEVRRNERLIACEACGRLLVSYDA